MFQSYQAYNPPADTRYEDWFDLAFHKDHQAAGLLPLDPPTAPTVWRVEHAYRDWKWMVDQLWETARRRQQQLDDKKEEATHCQRLLDKRASHKRQEAAH